MDELKTSAVTETAENPPAIVETPSRNLADDVDKLAETVAVLTTYAEGISRDLSALADSIENTPSGDLSPEYAARVKTVLDKYFHDDHPS